MLERKKKKDHCCSVLVDEGGLPLVKQTGLMLIQDTVILLALLWVIHVFPASCYDIFMETNRK